MSNPLVSIIVITYNSAEFVLETLESAKAQDYQNIELIVSDDCSTDNTVEICEDWLKENKDRFIRTKLLTVKKNTGIPANCNRGVKASTGEWIKLIAGDDTLTVSCIKEYVYQIQKIPTANIFHGSINVYKNTFERKNYIESKNYATEYFISDRITAEEQYQILFRGCLISAPSTFIKKEALRNVGYFDEKMPFEDWPMWLSLTKKGYKMHFIDKALVNYRVHGKSSFNYGQELLFNDFFLKEMIVFKKYIRDNIGIIEKVNEDFNFFRKLIMLKLGMNKNKITNRIMNNLFLKIYGKIRKKIVRVYFGR